MVKGEIAEVKGGVHEKVSEILTFLIQKRWREIRPNFKFWA